MGIRHSQSGQTDYLLLLIVIIVGVAAGNLLSNWITARIALYQTEQALIELNQELSNHLTTGAANLQQQLSDSSRALTEKARQQQLLTRQQRADSRTGQFLSKSCEEWKATHQRYDNYTSKLEMEKACRRYEDYLDTGLERGDGFR